MRWKKKGFGLLFLLLAGLAFTGCGNRQQTAAQPENEENVAEEAEPDEVGGTLVVYTDRLDMVETKFAEYKAIFEQDNPGTEIVFKAYSDYEQDVSEELAAGDYGDVVLIPQKLASGKLSDYFEPLGTVEELAETYDERYLYAAEQDGQVYGLAQYAMPQGIAYNKKVFEKAGIIEIPQTPEEFLSALEDIKAAEPEVLPVFIGQRRAQNLEWWQQQAQQLSLAGLTASDSQDLTWSRIYSKGQPGYIVCKLLYNVVNQGLSEEGGDASYSWKQVREMLNNGEIGCAPVDWSELAAMREAAPNPDDIGYMPFPYSMGVQYAVTSVGYCYAINKNSKNKVTARAWIDYMLNSSGYAKSENAVSIRKKDSLPDFLQLFENAIPIGSQIRMESGVEGVWVKLPDLPEDMRQSTEEYRRLIEAAGKGEESFREVMQNFGGGEDPSESAENDMEE